ncbi:MAG: hypothetical protein M3O82_02965 [Verrucomicrobiota bacterium]|nr:hypothetical protein [Verrucomicrobiota bacterium]
MKHRFALLFCLLAIALHARAQSAVKVTTTLHDDGSRTEMVTDPDQHTSEAKTLNAAGKLLQRIVYTLDEENQPAEGTIYSPAGAVLFKALYKRDPANRLSEEVDSTAAGAMIRRFVYEYDGNGKVSRIRAYDANGIEMTPSGGAKKASPPRRRR